MFLLGTIGPQTAQAQTEAVVHSFANVTSDGANPYAGLVMDAAGNLYGTTYGAGAYAKGTVFEVVVDSGRNTEKVLYSFGGDTSDGANPQAGLIMDTAGNLYGTTAWGGSSSNCSTLGCGTVFELVNSSGSYTEKVLYRFAGGTGDGATPYGGLVRDKAGNLYGTTVDGGASGDGTVFELINSSGTYTEKVLHSFGGSDGETPYAGLIMDSSGNLYGTTTSGGTAVNCTAGNGTPIGCGAVFELVNSSGSYTEKVLHSFGGSDGEYPDGPLIMDSSGNLYGTTGYGGDTSLNNGQGYGTVFELINSSGSYTEKVLHSFAGATSDGAGPSGGLIMDSAGDLYGTTNSGGSSDTCVGGCGTVFKLVNSSGSYTQNLLHSFGYYPPGDGVLPSAGLIMDSAGNFYGTTSGGGANLVGTVFEVVLGATPAVTFSATTLSFGSVAVGSSSTLSVTVTNSGAANLTFASGAVTISGADAADFAIASDGCSTQTLAPTTGTCSVSVTFAPSAAASETASLIFADNVPGGPQTVGLSGTGYEQAVTISPSSLTIAPQPVDTIGGGVLTLTNGETTPLTINSISTDLSVFSLDGSTENECSFSTPVPANGGTCNIGVLFTPTAPGTVVGALTVSYAGPGSPQTVTLSGTAIPVQSWTESSIHPFAGVPSDGRFPSSGLVMDSAGNLYGTTSYGGIGVNCPGSGEVFELVNSNGSYTEKVLYSFTGPPDGEQPGGGLTVDTAGNLYGTTGGGGTSGAGTVFELVNSSGSYTEKVLHSFTYYSADGASPAAGLVMDAAGDLYGVTTGGGTFGDGTVFELVNSSGSYTEKVLYSFAGGTTDGQNPSARLVIDSAGNLFGTTPYGGSSKDGVVFELVNSSGSYAEKVLHSFAGGATDGANPQAGLVMDTAGNFYGTTFGGGAYGKGAVYELVNSTGSYTEKVLHSFSGTDGANPAAGLMTDASDDLYGVTSSGSACATPPPWKAGFECGTVFELVNSSGSYAETMLSEHSPITSDLVMDGGGNLYGTRSGGFYYFFGDVFELAPGQNPVASLSSSYWYTGMQEFGTVTLGSSSTLTVTVTNTGTANLIFGSGAVMISGLNAADFAITSDACSGQTLAPATGTCTVNVTFTPGTAIRESAWLNFADNGLGGVQSTDLDGWGTSGSGGASVASVSPTSLSFSSQNIGTSSTGKTVTISNTGDGDLTISDISIQGANASSFSLAGSTCSATIPVAAGSGCTIDVIFTPTVRGTLSTTLSIADNAAGSPQTVSLSGTGTSLGVSLSPSSLNFSPQLVGSRSSSQTVTLSNPGSAAITVSGITIVGADAGDFPESNACGASLDPGAHCTINVAFKPGAGGTRTASLSIADDAAGSPQTVALSGTAEDFLLSAASGSSSSASVTAGKSATYSISVSPEGGFNQAVSLSCSGAPSRSTCSVSPALVTLDGSNSATAQVTVTTTASSFVPPRGPFPPPQDGPKGLPLLVGLLIALGVVALAATSRGKAAPILPLRTGCALTGPRRPGWVVVSRAVLAATVTLVLIWAACGGGGGSSSGGGNQTPGTPAGNYSLTVSGTYTSGSTSLKHDVVLKLTVN